MDEQAVANALAKASRHARPLDVWGKPAYSIADAARYVLVPTLEVEEAIRCEQQKVA